MNNVPSFQCTPWACSFSCLEYEACNCDVVSSVILIFCYDSFSFFSFQVLNIIIFGQIIIFYIFPDILYIIGILYSYNNIRKHVKIILF